jgi:hypothetical protein
MLCRTLKECDARLSQLAAQLSRGIGEEERQLVHDLQALGPDAWPLIARRALDQHERVSEVARYAMGEWPDVTDEHVDDISAALAHRPGGWPARALGRLATPTSIKVLLTDIARTGWSPTQSTFALAKTLPGSLNQILEAFTTPTTNDQADGIRTVFRWLTTDDDRTRAIAGALAERAGTRDRLSVPALALLLEIDGSVTVKTAPIEPLVASANRKVRDLATEALIRFGNDVGLEPLLRRCREVLIRHPAPDGPASMSTDEWLEAVDCLEPLARMGHRGVRAVPLLVERADVVHADIRSAVLVTLGYTGDASVTTTLRRRLESEDDRDVTASLESLWRLQSRHSLPAIGAVAASHWYQPVRAFASQVSTALRGGDPQPVAEAVRGVNTLHGRLTDRHATGTFLARLDDSRECATWVISSGASVEAVRWPRRPEWRSVSLGEGRLVGRDKGEFGGGLWYRSGAGSERLLLADSVVGLFATGGDSAITFSNGAFESGRIAIVAMAGESAFVRRARRLPSALRFVRPLGSGWLAELLSNRAFLVSRDLSLREVGCALRRP